MEMRLFNLFTERERNASTSTQAGHGGFRISAARRREAPKS